MNPTLPVSRLIQVSVSITQAGAQGRNFSDLMIVGDSNVISGLERTRDYQGLSAIAQDFGVTAPEYLAALIYYSQSPQPTDCTIGRWLRTATSGMLQGAILNAAQMMLSNFIQITNGGMTLTVDGVVKNLTALNFSAQTNLNGVASIVTTAFGGAAVCTWNGSQFSATSATTGAGEAASGTITLTANPTAGNTVTVNGVLITFVAAITGANQVLIGATAQITATNLYSLLLNSTSPNLLQATYSITGAIVAITYYQVGVAGDAFTLAASGGAITLSAATLGGGQNPSSVSYATPPGAGQDVSTLMGLTAALALPLVPGYAAESALEAVVALDAASSEWYGLEFGSSVMPDDDDNLAIAAFINADATTRLFGITIQNTNVLSSEVTNDLCSQLVALEYNQVFTQYCSSNPYAVGSVFGRFFTVNFSGQNTMIDMMYKQEPGIAAEFLTTDQANVLQSKHCNVYATYDNQTSIFQYSQTCGSNFIDETYIANWVQNAAQTALFNVNYTSTTKIPQTDAGMNAYVNAITGVCQQAVTNGSAAPGQWNAAGFGSLSQGQFLTLGYYVYAPPISSQSESDRAVRKSVPFQSALKLAGSTQTVDLLMTINQ